jgi:hypothetical protein
MRKPLLLYEIRKINSIMSKITRNIFPKTREELDNKREKLPVVAFG